MNNKENIGNVDRVIRVYTAIFFMASFISGLIPGVTGLILFLVAIYLVITVLTGVCSFYKMFKIQTNRRRANTHYRHSRTH